MKKISALILAIFLCFTALASCESEQTETGPEKDTAEKLSLADPDLPKSDFGGYTFRVLTRDEHQYWNPIDFASHELTSEAINDAVFRRTDYIESTYNVKLEQIMAEDYLGEATNTVLAADDKYDAFLMDIWRSATLAQQDLLIDYSELGYVDLEKDCWDKSILRDSTIANKQYFALGDINIVDNNATWCVLFNKDLYADLDLGNPYETVKEGKWTIDLMHENCKNNTKDLDGDGSIDYLNDQWGAVGEYANVSAFFSGMGVRYVEKNKDDIPEYNLDNPKAVAAFEKIYAFMHGQESMVRADDYQMPDYWNIVNVNTFKGGRAIYYTCPMTHVVQMRDMEDDYGILPLPKYDEAQENYHTTVQVLNATAYTIPKTNTDLDRTGIILQAMATASTPTLTPAYYDVTLERRSTRDEESKEMLDIIFANRILDISNMFDWAQIRTSIEDIVRHDSNTYVSTVDSLKESLIVAMNATVNDFKA